MLICYLSAYDKLHKTSKEIEDEDIIIGSYGEVDTYSLIDKLLDDDDTNYVLLNNNKPFKRNIARINPIITSLCVIDIGMVASVDIDSVIRINTDNVTFKKQINYKQFKNLELEEKTTGKIRFHNVMKLEKLEN